MTYDHWKSTNPADNELGPDPFEDLDSYTEWLFRRKCKISLSDLLNDMRRRDWQLKI